VLDAAKANGHRDGENPARWKGHLETLLPPRKKLSRGHHAAMPYRDVPAFVKRLGKRVSLSNLALEFTILTAARSGETRGATWSEFLSHDALWVIPPERMKEERQHRVPLHARALEILEIAKRIAGKRQSELVFPGLKRNRPLSENTLKAALRRAGAGDYTPHGFRSSFRDWAGDETDFAREVAEAALSHRVGDDSELAYRRGDALLKRRKLMQEWAEYLSGKQTVPLTISETVDDHLKGVPRLESHFSQD
jgi:integrase